MRAASAASAVLLAFAAPASADVWSDSYDPATKTRFIPVELWTGGPWDGKRTINFAAPANLSMDGGKKTIKGPVDWTDPLTGDTLKVYRRVSQRGRNLTVTQMFVIREDGEGIGRVYDSRYPTQAMRGESKFPAGLWTEGESRTYKIDNYNTEKKRLIPNFESSVTLTMEQIDHRHIPWSHCMTFRWQLTNRGKMVDNNAYTYCPEKGLVSLDDD